MQHGRTKDGGEVVKGHLVVALKLGYSTINLSLGEPEKKLLAVPLRREGGVKAVQLKK